VLIKVTAAGLNTVDHGLAAGMMAQMIPHEYPLVLAGTPPLERADEGLAVLARGQARGKIIVNVSS
jgi:hypothetical protein